MRVTRLTKEGLGPGTPTSGCQVAGVHPLNDTRGPGPDQPGLALAPHFFPPVSRGTGSPTPTALRPGASCLRPRQSSGPSSGRGLRAFVCARPPGLRRGEDFVPSSVPDLRAFVGARAPFPVGTGAPSPVGAMACPRNPSQELEAQEAEAQEVGPQGVEARCVEPQPARGLIPPSLPSASIPIRPNASSHGPGGASEKQASGCPVSSDFLRPAGPASGLLRNKTRRRPVSFGFVRPAGAGERASEKQASGCPVSSDFLRPAGPASGLLRNGLTQVSSRRAPAPRARWRGFAAIDASDTAHGCEQGDYHPLCSHRCLRRRPWLRTR